MLPSYARELANKHGKGGEKNHFCGVRNSCLVWCSSNDIVSKKTMHFPFGKLHSEEHIGYGFGVATV